MSLPWSDRAVEEANLFNPAFCALMVGTTAKEYQKKTGQAMPFAIAFLVLPIALHETTRKELPHSTVTSLLTWLQDHRTALVGFVDRISALRQMTQEALMFGLGHGALSLADGGLLTTKQFKTATPVRVGDDFTRDALDCVEASAFLGRWFAAVGSTSTIFSAWGVAP